jgi:outer membrane scaffolding protein for murein synthesis (MipA/OmpV family)
LRVVYLLLILILFLDAKESQLDLGIGTAVINYPDYMGSKSYRTVVFAFPFIKYNSEYFSIDKHGINTKIFNIKDLSLDISASGSLPANSDDNEARKGMPDLHLTFEVGPKLIYNAYKSKKTSIDIEMAIRGVLETDWKTLDYQGVVGTTEARFEYIYKGIEFTYRIGVMFANEKYHNYFYGVDGKYITPTRKLYNAKSGYNSFKNKFGFTYRYNKNWWCGGYASYNNIAGAVFEDSPLIETKHAVFTGASIAYIFYVK